MVTMNVYNKFYSAVNSNSGRFFALISKNKKYHVKNRGRICHHDIDEW